MRILLSLLMVLLLLVGCNENLTKETATSKVMDKVPECEDNLETINKVLEAKENEDGFIIKFQQDCEPNNGEGPEMRTTYTYAVTADGIILKDGDTHISKDPVVTTTDLNSNKESFTASISVHNQLKSNEVFIVEATLKNLSDNDLTIVHASGVFYFSIKDSNGKGVNTFGMHMVGIVSTLQGKGTITEKYTYRLKKPGFYEVSATAKFTVGEGDNEKDIELETNKASFEVIAQN